jgi:ATP-dependent protease ClpP protease subunit
MTRTRHRVELPDRQRWNALRARPVNRHVGGDWFTIGNKAGKDDGATVVDIYGEIGGAWWDETAVSATGFIDQLRGISTDSIELHINSPGGDVYDGIAIYQALLDHPANVQVQIDAIAASAASFIAQAGDTIVMGANAEMMIHDALGMCVGNAADMREFSGMLDKASDNIASIYAARAGNGGVPKWRQRMEDETWYSASEAVEAGLADEVVKVGKRGAGNTFDLSDYKHRNRADAPPPELIDEPAKLLDTAPVGEMEPGGALPDEAEIDDSTIPWDPKAMHLGFLDAIDAVGLVDDTSAQRTALETDFEFDSDAFQGFCLDLLDHADPVEAIAPQPHPKRTVDIDDLTESLREALTQ